MNPKSRMLTMLIPKELHIAVKVKAAQEGTSISKVVREFLRCWVEEPPFASRLDAALRGEVGDEIADPPKEPSS